MALELKAWHWRQALQIAAQLPEGEEDARIVMDCVEEILALISPSPPTAPAAPDGGGAQLLRLPGVPSSPSRRASSNGNASVFPK
jgi:hypothetical protein